MTEIDTSKQTAIEAILEVAAEEGMTDSTVLPIWPAECSGVDYPPLTLGDLRVAVARAEKAEAEASEVRSAARNLERRHIDDLAAKDREIEGWQAGRNLAQQDCEEARTGRLLAWRQVESLRADISDLRIRLEKAKGERDRAEEQVDRFYGTNQP